MNRRGILRAFSAASLAVVACAGGLRIAGAGQRGGSVDYSRCAKACDACAASCRACSKHCAGMVSGGMKEHAKTKALADDNADICALAAKICARRGPASAAICEACAKSCDACGGECGKYPSMKPMKDCAGSCSTCARACRDLVKALSGK